MGKKEGDAWRVADSKRFLIYQQAGVKHLIAAESDGFGLCTPTAEMTVCGHVRMAQLEPFNGVGYGERTAREAACLFGRGFCGRCVATLARAG